MMMLFASQNNNNNALRIILMLRIYNYRPNILINASQNNAINIII